MSDRLKWIHDPKEEPKPVDQDEHPLSALLGFLYLFEERKPLSDDPCRPNMPGPFRNVFLWWLEKCLALPAVITCLECGGQGSGNQNYVNGYGDICDYDWTCATCDGRGCVDV